METNNITEVIEFLNHLENKSIIPKSTALGRKSAANKFFDLLTDPQEQTAQYVLANFDRLYERFKNKNATSFTGKSLETYKSRFKSVIDDFFAWKEDPAAWERSLNNKGPRTSNTNTSKQKAEQKNKETAAQETVTSANPPTTRKLSLPISPNVEVKVELPITGISTSELHRLGMFLFPYCNDLSTESWSSQNWPIIATQK